MISLRSKCSDLIRSIKIQPNLSMPIVTEGVAAYYNTTPEVLLKCTRGPQHDNESRKVAISPEVKREPGAISSTVSGDC